MPMHRRIRDEDRPPQSPPIPTLREQGRQARFDRRQAMEGAFAAAMPQRMALQRDFAQHRAQQPGSPIPPQLLQRRQQMFEQMAQDATPGIQAQRQALQQGQANIGLTQAQGFATRMDAVGGAVGNIGRGIGAATAPFFGFRGAQVTAAGMVDAERLAAAGTVDAQRLASDAQITQAQIEAKTARRDQDLTQRRLDSPPLPIPVHEGTRLFQPGEGFIDAPPLPGSFGPGADLRRFAQAAGFERINDWVDAVSQQAGGRDNAIQDIAERMGRPVEEIIDLIIEENEREASMGPTTGDITKRAAIESIPLIGPSLRRFGF